MKLKIYKFLFAILIISAITTIILIIIKYGKNQINEFENQKIVETFSREIGTRWGCRNDRYRDERL